MSQPTFKERAEQARLLFYDAFRRIDQGEEVDFSIFQGVVGVRLQPMPWDELAAALADGSEEAMGTLGRLPLDIKKYYDYRDQVILKEFASVTDYLLVKVFSVQTKEAADGRKVAVLPPDFDDTLRIVWRENDFPYSFEEGLEHHNVWANRPLSAEQLQQVIAQHRQGWETQHYINPPALMSVPSLWHAHVISRRPPSP